MTLSQGNYWRTPCEARAKCDGIGLACAWFKGHAGPHRRGAYWWYVGTSVNYDKAIQRRLEDSAAPVVRFRLTDEDCWSITIPIIGQGGYYRDRAPVAKICRTCKTADDVTWNGAEWFCARCFRPIPGDWDADGYARVGVAEVDFPPSTINLRDHTDRWYSQQTALYRRAAVSHHTGGNRHPRYNRLREDVPGTVDWSGQRRRRTDSS